MQDQAFLGPESGARRARRGRRRRPLRRHPVAARRPGPGGGQPRAACRRLTRLHLAGVGGAFGGREDLSMQVHVAMLALHTGRPGEDGLLAGGVVLRSRPPPPRADELRARRGRRRPAGLRSGQDRPRRRCLRVEQHGGGRQRRARSPAARTTCPTPASTASWRTPTTRRAVRCAASGRCRWPSPTSRRWTASPHALELDPVEIRLRNALRDRYATAHRAGGGRARAGARAARASSGPCRCRSGRASRPTSRDLPGGRVEHHPRRGHAPRRRLRRGVQEHRLLRGLRRLLHGAGAGVARRRRPAGADPHRRGRGGAGPRDRAGADRPHRAGSSSGSRSCRPTRMWARPGARPRRARPG